MFGQALIWLLVYLPIIGFVVGVVGAIARASGYIPGFWIAIAGLVLILIGAAFWIWFVRNVDIG